MTLIPKNWTTFQHYKDRSPAWIKLHRSILDDFEFSRLPVASRALAPLLWLLASEYTDGKITASNEELVYRLRMSASDLEDAIRPLITSGFFIETNDVAQCSRDASVMLAERKTDACLEKEIQEQKEEEKNSRAVADATRTECAKLFDEFWEEYPKRQGSQPRDPALKAFLRSLVTGRKYEINRDAAAAIIGGAKRYAAELREEGKIGTPYVVQAVKWLKEKRWQDYPEKPPDEPCVPGKYYAKGQEIEAWDEYRRATEGKAFPRDRGGGWWVDSQWPPGHEQQTTH